MEEERGGFQEERVAGEERVTQLRAVGMGWGGGKRDGYGCGGTGYAMAVVEGEGRGWTVGFVVHHHEPDEVVELPGLEARLVGAHPAVEQVEPAVGGWSRVGVVWPFGGGLSVIKRGWRMKDGRRGRILVIVDSGILGFVHLVRGMRLTLKINSICKLLD